MATLGKEALNDALDAWAKHLAAQATPDKPLAIIGMISHGDVLAQRLIDRLQQHGIQAQYGALDISLYRDDFDMHSCKPALRSSYLPFSTDGLHVVLVDDVVQTGRTVRAALNALFEYGRPAGVQLHCLVDRGGRELPIAVDYAAFHLSVDTTSKVTLRLQEIDGADELIHS